MDHAGGGVPESNWPQSLDKPLTREVYNFGLLVPPGCRLAKPWRICKDGYPTLDNPATPEQLRVHPGGRYNTRGRHDYWDGKTTTTSSGLTARQRWQGARRRRRSPPARWCPRLFRRSTRCHRNSSSSARTATRRGY
ncbi:hypothetical protein ZWY2020_040301 [Hordeum vulgare]|nr:hypothetical protein ZWY2020_040301 [Hordeum vulgare]